MLSLFVWIVCHSTSLSLFLNSNFVWDLTLIFCAINFYRNLVSWTFRRRLDSISFLFFKLNKDPSVVFMQQLAWWHLLAWFSVIWTFSFLHFCYPHFPQSWFYSKYFPHSVGPQPGREPCWASFKAFIRLDRSSLWVFPARPSYALCIEMSEALLVSVIVRGLVYLLFC